MSAEANQLAARVGENNKRTWANRVRADELKRAGIILFSCREKTRYVQRELTRFDSQLEVPCGVHYWHPAPCHTASATAEKTTKQKNF